MNESKLLKHSRFWDRAGLWTSAACLIHCLATPFAILAYPVLNESLMHSLIHWTLLPVVLGVAFFSFFFSFRQHRNVGPVLLGSVALITLVLSPLADRWGWGGSLEMGFMIVGSMTLISAHLWNMRACHCFCEASCSHKEHHEHDGRHTHGDSHDYHTPKVSILEKTPE